MDSADVSGSHCNNYARLTLIADGFFDAGMLLSALKSNEAHKAKTNDPAAAKRREVGKRLQLTEY